MTLEETKKHAAELAKRATEQSDGGEAMKYAQAACNVVNAFSTLVDAENRHTRPKP